METAAHGYVFIPTVSLNAKLNKQNGYLLMWKRTFFCSAVLQPDLSHLWFTLRKS